MSTYHLNSLGVGNRWKGTIVPSLSAVFQDNSVSELVFHGEHPDYASESYLCIALEVYRNDSKSVTSQQPFRS